MNIITIDKKMYHISKQQHKHIIYNMNIITIGKKMYHISKQQHKHIIYNMHTHHHETILA